MRLFIESKADKARAERVQDAINRGDMPKPPRTGKPNYVCEVCGALTVPLTEVDGYGRICNACLRDIEEGNTPARQRGERQ